MRKQNWPGCPRNDDRDHGRPPGLLAFELAYHHENVPRPQPTLKRFAPAKRVWTLSSLWELNCLPNRIRSTRLGVHRPSPRTGDFYLALTSSKKMLDGATQMSMP